MAEEENEQGVDEQPAEEQAPATDEQTPAEEQAPADEQVAPPADDAAATPAAPAAEAAEPAEQLSPKERRRRARSTHSGPARPSRTPEERRDERAQQRAAAAAARRRQRAKDRTKAAERRRSATPAQPLAPVHAPTAGRRKERQGVVVSDRADKTITVRVDIARRHRRYEKIVRSSGTLHAHDENNDARIGDTVRLIESRPLSRTKRWRLVDVLERAE